MLLLGGCHEVPQVSQLHEHAPHESIAVQ